MLDATRLHRGLYMGSAPTTGNIVRALGFDVLVLCAEEYQLRSRNFPGVLVLHAPLDDDPTGVTPRDADTMFAAGREVAKHMSQGRKVLVTCMAGRNRSGVVSALALYFLTGAPGVQIVRHIRRTRVGIDGGASLTNPRFVELLRQLPEIRKSA